MCVCVCTLDQAGITTTLNSRCSVLAAANGVYGRWDDTKGAENIDFMPTILSRFDTIFVVRDEHDMNRDIVSTFFVILFISYQFFEAAVDVAFCLSTGILAVREIGCLRCLLF